MDGNIEESYKDASDETPSSTDAHRPEDKSNDESMDRPNYVPKSGDKRRRRARARTVRGA